MGRREGCMGQLCWRELGRMTPVVVDNATSKARKQAANRGGPPGAAGMASCGVGCPAEDALRAASARLVADPRRSGAAEIDKAGSRRGSVRADRLTDHPALTMGPDRAAMGRRDSRNGTLRLAPALLCMRPGLADSDLTMPPEDGR